MTRRATGHHATTVSLVLVAAHRESAGARVDRHHRRPPSRGGSRRYLLSAAWRPGGTSGCLRRRVRPFAASGATASASCRCGGGSGPAQAHRPGPDDCTNDERADDRADAEVEHGCAEETADPEERLQGGCDAERSVG